MKPIFTVHAGEFLVGDYINRNLGRKYNVWVPTKDTGIDLLVTTNRTHRKTVSLQVKLSRSYDIKQEFVGDVLATSWFTLKPAKIRHSTADIWVFVILTPRQTEHYVLVPIRELIARIPKRCGSIWHLYLWVYRKGCYETRTLDHRQRFALPTAGSSDKRLDFSAYLDNWAILHRMVR